MSDVLDVQFMPLSAASAGTIVVLAGEELALGPAARGVDERMKGGLTKAAKAATSATRRSAECGLDEH